MDKLKLIAFDIDGTLLPVGENKLKPELIKALKKVQEKGIKTIVASGRCSYLIPSYILEALNADFYITINGALVCDKDLKTIDMHPFSLDEMQRITEVALKYDLPMAYKFEKHIAVYNRFEDYFKNYTSGVGISQSKKEIQKIIVDHSKNHDYHTMFNSLPLGAYFIGDAKILEKAKKDLDFVECLSTVFGNSFECAKKGVSKALGLKDVASFLKVDLRETMAFGDGENDIEMLKAAGLGIAMGQASEAVKNSADFVTAACKEDGVIKALRDLEVIA